MYRIVIFAGDFKLCNAYRGKDLGQLGRFLIKGCSHRQARINVLDGLKLRRFIQPAISQLIYMHKVDQDRVFLIGLEFLQRPFNTLTPCWRHSDGTLRVTH